MKAIPRMSVVEFKKRFNALVAAQTTQSTATLKKSFYTLLTQISDGRQFKTLWRFCNNIGTRSIRTHVLEVWNQMMEVRLLMEVELRKPIFACLDWFVAHAREYGDLYKQSAPGASIRTRILQLFKAAGYPLPA
ncbi:MAG: hypothetical protein WCO79_03300 [bacterium]